METTSTARVKVEKLVLAKYDGDAPAAGVFKMPTELVISGDGRVAASYFPQADGMAEADVKRLMDTESDFTRASKGMV